MAVPWGSGQEVGGWMSHRPGPWISYLALPPSVTISLTPSLDCFPHSRLEEELSAFQKRNLS